MYRPEVRYAPAADGSKISYTVIGDSPLAVVTLREIDGVETTEVLRNLEEFFDLVAEGLSNKQIAYRRSISPNTVDAHLRSIYRKMQVRSRATLVRRMMSDRVT